LPDADLHDKDTAPNTSANNTKAPNSTEMRPKLLLSSIKKHVQDSRGPAAAVTNSSENDEESSSSEEKLSEREMLIEFKERWEEEFFLDNTYQINYSPSSYNT